MLAGLRDFKKYLFTTILMLASFFCEAKIAFWQPKPSSLTFTTASQNLFNLNCSSVVTIQNRNSQNVATNVSSNLTINLSTTDNVQFYSDRACTTPITSVTINAGTNSANFYYISTQTGSVSFKANATTYTEISQAATINTNPFIWTNAFGNNFWNTAANWSGGAVPGSSDVAIFTTACGASCDITFNSAVNIKGIRILSNFLGNLNQATAVTITVGSNGWVQESGTFWGSNANINIGNNFILSNSTFNASTGTTTLFPSATTTSVIARFASTTNYEHNNGTFEYAASCENDNLDFNSSTFNFFNLKANCNATNFNSRTITVLKNFKVVPSAYSHTLSTGIFEVYGNIDNENSFGGTFNGSTIIRLKGNASGQTINTFSNILFPYIEIDSPNDVTINGHLKVYSLKIINVNNLITTGSTVQFHSRCGSDSAQIGNNSFNHIILSGQCLNLTFDGGTPTVNGNLTLLGDQYGTNINNVNFQIYGNFSSSGTHPVGGNAQYTLKGNASGQNIEQTNSNTNIPNLIIDSGSQNITILNNLKLTKSVNFISYGSVNIGSYDVTIQGECSATHSLNFNTVTLNNVTMVLNCATYNISNTIKVSGNLNFTLGDYGNTLNGGTIEVGGNINLTSTASAVGGTTLIKLNGNSNQSLDAKSKLNHSIQYSPLNSSHTLTLNSSHLASSAGRSLTVNSGNVNLAGFNLNVNSLSLNSNALTKNSGILTVNSVVVGTGSLYGGTINP